MKRFALAALLIAIAASGPALAQRGVDPAQLSRPATDAWPTYNGDYSGRRFSTLKAITDANVQALSLAWVYRIAAGGPGGSIKATPLQVDGVLYFSLPDHVWAVDARTGRERWHFAWQSKGGDHIGNRGVAISGDSLYFETPDCNLVALDIKDGTERWHQSICDLDLYYFGTSAPVVIRNHVIAGVSGDDLDIPGYVESHDPVTGERQWRWYVVPQKKGDPGSDSWPDEEAARHGGGMTWQPVTYDPDLNLVYVATGNPQPVVAHVNRAGDNLFTASIVALDADTGKMAWYFQASPHDTHDWDATQTPVLIDDVVNGKPRKLVAQASRNGKFFLLDRTNGKVVVTSDFVKTNWSQGTGPDGRPIPNPAKHPQVDGALVTPNQGGAANWPPPSFSPATGLLYVPATQGWSIWYIYDPGENPQGWGGTDRGGYSESMLTAIDYKTGKTRWTHQWAGPARAGVVSTAGNVLFTGGNSNSLVALNATTGDALWQARLNAPIANGPITYTLDGLQYVVVGAGDSLWSFVLNAPPGRR